MKNTIKKLTLTGALLFIFSNLILAQSSGDCGFTVDLGDDITISCGEETTLNAEVSEEEQPEEPTDPGCSSAADMIVDPAGGAYINSVSTTGGISSNINNPNTLVDGDNPSMAWISHDRWYSSFMDQIVDTEPGGEFMLNLEGNQGPSGSNPTMLSFRIWIDWNNDGDFNNTDELVHTTSISGASPSFFNDIPIAVPANQPPGIVRMRIRIKYGASFVESDGACTKSNSSGWVDENGVNHGNYDFTSEVEDYAVEIIGSTGGNPGSDEYTYSWSPSEGLSESDIENPIVSPDETTTYTVTVIDENGCVETDEITVTVEGAEEPIFTNPGPICTGEELADLPTTSNNGIEGSWEPSTINNQETTTYTFTPDNDDCAQPIDMTIEVNDEVLASFDEIGPFCEGEEFELPTTSNNNIEGTWSPAINNETTTTYTFTPDENGCATNTELEVVIHPNPYVDAGPDKSICVGGEVQLEGDVEETNSPGGEDELIYHPETNEDFEEMEISNQYWHVHEDGNPPPPTSGTLPELDFEPPGNISPEPYVSTPLIDATGYQNITLEFDEAIAAWGGNITLGVQTSLDGNTWTTQYTEEPTGMVAIDVGTTITVPLIGMENQTFYLRFIILDNEEENLTGWYISNIYVTGSTESAGESSFVWTPNDDLSQDDILDPTATPDETTTYTLTVTDENGCTASDEMTVSIENEIIPTFDLPEEVCEGEDISLPTTSQNGVEGTWNPTEFNSSISEYHFTPTDEDGCAEAVSVIIEITDEIVPTFDDLGPFCQDENFNLPTVSNNGIGGTWSPEVNVHATTSYVFTPNDDEVCATNSEMTVIVNNEITPNFDVIDVDGCAPLTVTFINQTDAQNSDCIWDFGDGTIINDCGSEISHTYNYAGSFDVTLTITTEAGCEGSYTIEDAVQVTEDPIANATASPMEIKANDTEVTFTNSSQNASQYDWDFGDGSSIEHTENPTHVYPEEGNESSYVITLIASNGENCADTTRIIINVVEDIIYYVPNAFTPDNDQFNETFKPIFTSGFDPLDYELLIFNRWGELVFESHNTEIGWDGTYGNKRVQDGTYVWKIEFKETNTDERHKTIGHITVIR